MKDANALDVDDPLVAIDNALKQGAFIMWNHPGWPNDSSTIYPVHKELIKKRRFMGWKLLMVLSIIRKVLIFVMTINWPIWGIQIYMACIN